jgi:3',5'-cyclic AMP phosphodiesterase CpdA
VVDAGRSPTLLATSDIHVGFRQNRTIVEGMRPTSDDDWLIVAGDVGEVVDHIVWGLRLLKERFATVLWVPGNHELWTHPNDPVQLRGQARSA